MPASSRHSRIPNANNPRLLARLLEMISTGIRSTRGLREALGVEERTVQYYTQAADWLGLLDTSGEPVLTPLGLEYVYGDDRDAVYTRAVWATPFVEELMTGRPATLPSVEVVAGAIATSDPELSPATVRRRASAIRSLLAPALAEAPAAKATARQLALPFAQPDGVAAPPPKLTTGREYNPDVYRYLLAHLLDHGELTLGQVRALLDRAGAQNAPIGGYVDMAISRGDASRRDERLVVSPAACTRRDLVETTTSVMLSDPGYRTYLDACSAAADGDRAAEIRRDQVAGRYRPWDTRLFGHPLRAESLAKDLASIVLDRPLSAFPLATPGQRELFPVAAPFLDTWQQPAVAISLPPTLSQLLGGVPTINRILRQARTADDVGLPSLAHRPSVYHGGILHPGEPLPRSVPDTRSLRLRLLMHSPYPALLTALLLLHRAGTLSVEERRGRWKVVRDGKSVGDLLVVLDSFAAHRQWLVARRLGGGLQTGVLVDVLETSGIAMVVGRTAVLAERFFAQLRNEAEEIEIAAQLNPLAEALEAWMSDK